MPKSDWAIVAIAVITALPNLIAAIVAAKRAGGAQTAAQNANQSASTTHTLVADGVKKVNEVQKAIGATNGENVQQLLADLKTLQDYSHKRNHDLIEGLAATNLRLDVIGETVGAKVPPLPDTVRAMLEQREKDRLAEASQEHHRPLRAGD